MAKGLDVGTSFIVMAFEPSKKAAAAAEQTRKAGHDDDKSAGLVAH